MEAARGKTSAGWLYGFKLHLLRKRAIIETINDQLKNICQIEHSRHRSPINLIAGPIASCHQSKKPSLGLHPLAIESLAYPELTLSYVVLVQARGLSHTM